MYIHLCTDIQLKNQGKGWQSMSKRLMACALAVLTALMGGAMAQEDWERARVPQGLWVWIDVPRKTLTLYEGTQARKSYAIATGTYQTPSPIGSWRIVSRFAGELGGFGTRFLGLNVPWGQYGIHGTNKPGSIGSNASHGCIRMHVKDSEELYRLVPNGTRVVVEGGPYGLLDDSLPTLEPGDRSHHVAAVQARLLQLGYTYQWPDGVYGPATQQAVTKARRALGMAQKDLIDYAFYQAIGLILFE